MNHATTILTLTVGMIRYLCPCSLTPTARGERVLRAQGLTPRAFPLACDACSRSGRRRTRGRPAPPAHSPRRVRPHRPEEPITSHQRDAHGPRLTTGTLVTRLSVASGGRRGAGPSSGSPTCAPSSEHPGPWRNRWAATDQSRQ